MEAYSDCTLLGLVTCCDLRFYVALVMDDACFSRVMMSIFFASPRWCFARFPVRCADRRRLLLLLLRSARRRGIDHCCGCRACMQSVSQAMPQSHPGLDGAGVPLGGVGLVGAR
jgi:hypothetical protein